MKNFSLFSLKTRHGFMLALLVGASALLFSAMNAGGQTATRAPQAQATPTPAATPTSKPEKTPSDIIDDIETVSVESNLVVVPVSVTDATGQPVQGLTTKDFRLLEEGREQEITQIGDPEQVPLEIAVLLDVSGSVDARFAFEQQAASRFLKQVLKSGDRATVYAIDKAPRQELKLDTAENASAKIMSLTPARSATAFYDAVIAASKYLAENTPERHRRVIVVISDGEDNFSDKVKQAIGATKESQEAVTPQARQIVYNKVLSEVQREVQKAEIAFYSINPSGEALRLNVISKRAEEGMERLAEATGGTSFVPEKEENFEAVFRQIAAELRSQYLLQYYSSDDSANGKYLRLKASVPTHPQLRVRARQGYYAKRK
jgi:Ca-activated chloride channel family protein